MKRFTCTLNKVALQTLRQEQRNQQDTCEFPAKRDVPRTYRRCGPNFTKENAAIPHERITNDDPSTSLSPAPPSRDGRPLFEATGKREPIRNLNTIRYCVHLGQNLKNAKPRSSGFSYESLQLWKIPLDFHAEESVHGLADREG
jgi:hypothetical protein